MSQQLTKSKQGGGCPSTEGHSCYYELLIEVLPGVGGGLHFTDDFQIVVETSLSQNTSLVKFSWRYDRQLSPGQVHNCSCLVEACALQMTSH